MAVSMSGLEIGKLYTRPELAALWGYKKYNAIARGVFTPRASGLIVLFVTRQKQETLTQYRDFISGEYLHWEGEEKHRTDARIARAHESGEEIHLFYRDVHHTPFQYRGPLEIRQYLERTTQPSRFIFQLVHDLSPADDVAIHQSELDGLEPTEREAVVRARVGQGKFRESLLGLWKGCAVTNITAPDLLRASHIKPWRFSENAERINAYNGLLLVPQYDHLFDRGYITFDDEGRIELSPAISAVPLDALGIQTRARLRRVLAEHQPFLEFHQRHVFIARTPSA